MFEHQEFENDHSSDTENNFGPDQGFEASDGGDHGFANDPTFSPEETASDVEAEGDRVAGFDEDVVCEVNETSDQTDDSEFTDNSGRTRTNEVLDLIAGVENQLEQMRDAQTACVNEIESIEDRRQSLMTREGELAELARQLEIRSTEFEQRQSDLADRERHLDESRATIEMASNEIVKRERELDDRGARFEQNENDLKVERSELEVGMLELRRERENMESERQELVGARASAQAEVASLRRRSEELEASHGTICAERDALTDRINDLSGSLQEMSGRASLAEENSAALEQQMLELSTKLEEAANAIDARDEQIKDRDAQINERDAQINDRDALISERDGQLFAREAEFEELQSNLGLATDKLQSLANALTEQAPRLEEGAAAAALCRQQEARLKSLNDDLAAARAELTRFEKGADPEGLLSSTREELQRVQMELDEMIPLDEHRRVVSSLEARLAQGGETRADGNGVANAAMKAELEKARAELEALAGHVEQCESSLRTAEEKVITLQGENERLQRLTDIAEANATGDQTGDDGRLREQANRLAEYAMHLQRRRARLHAVRTEIDRRKRFAGTAEEATPYLVDDEHRNKAAEEDLLRRQHELVDVESRMIRRWARQGTVGVVAKATFLVVVLAAASWFGVMWFSPGNVSASALVKAQPVAGGTMDAERGAAWNEWHKTVLNDDLFAKAVAARLGSSVAGFAGGADAVKSTIADHLTVTDVEPGMLGFQLSGTDRGETMRVLQAMVATLSAESQRQLPRRGDGARMNVLTPGGRVATLDPVAVTSGQVQKAGMVFGGSLGLVGLLGAAVYTRLSRSRRIFDENLGIDEAEMI